MHRTPGAPTKAAVAIDMGSSLSALVELTGAERVAIAITDRNDNLVLEATPAFSEIHQVDHPILIDALAGRRQLEIAGSPRLLLTVALVGDGRVAAALAVPDDAETERRFSRWSDLVLAHVSRSLLTERDRRRSLEMQRLNATAQRVAATLDPKAVLTEIVRDATALLGADGGDIVLKDKERPVLRVVAVADIPATMVGFEMELGEGLTSYAMKTGRPVMETDYRHSKRRARRLDVYGFKSVLCAPLISRGEAIGAINVHDTKEHRRFTQEEIELLTAFAGYAAVAIDNARRYQRESVMAADLVEVNDALARSLSLQQRLVGFVLADEGPQAVAQELADLLRVPVVLQDDGLRLVAGAAPDSTDWRSLGVPRSMLNEPEFARFLDLLLQTSHASGMQFESEAGGSWRIVPVRAGPRDVQGYLILPAQEPALTPLDQALIEVATTAVALEFSKRRARVDVEQKLRGDVVMDLLSGSFDSEDAIIARAARLGFDLSVPRDVIALRVDGLETPESVGEQSREIALRGRVFDTLYEAVAARSAESMMATHGQTMIMLAAQCEVGQGGYGGLEPEVLVGELRRLVVPMLPRDAAVGAAIGSRCAAVPDYQASFRLTQLTLDALRRLNIKGATLATKDLGVFRFVISSSSREEVVLFARQRLAPLLESGDYGRNLLRTLRLYIDAGFNQREAARRGFAHPNTIGYRLRRVEELLKVSLSDPQALVDLAFAVKLADLVGL